MIKKILDVLMGSFYWTILKKRDRLDYYKIVLVLSGENVDVDRFALKYLDKAIERKGASSAIIYIMEEETKLLVEEELHSCYPTMVKVMPKDIINHIYRRYTIEKFYKNIFWTFIDKTKDNLLGRFIRETDINAEDVVCLAIYNFRQVPNKG